MWHLEGVPNAEFYVKLHPYLKRWPVTCNASKSAIGSFYIEIDRHFADKGSRTDNVYRYVDTFIQSNYPPNHLMSYSGISKSVHQNEVEVLKSEVSHCTEQLQTLNIEVVELRQHLQSSREQLQSARIALRDVTNEKCLVQNQKELYCKKLKKSKELQSCMEEELADLHLRNIHLSMELTELEQEVHDAGSVDPDSFDHETFSLQTKHGRKYAPAIRKLYYSLLAKQVPTTKIADIIKTVLKCFDPSLDVDQLKLPQHSCASYMRKDGAVAINEVVISVNELSDGTAISVVEDISLKLQKLRNVAHALGMPNSNSINSLVASATSDSAASQKKVNTLVERCREADEHQFGPAKLEAFDLIENFCSMHLGVNLRKAFLNGIKSVDSTIESDKHHPLDTLVHEFCKLFGKHDIPKYGCGERFI